MFRRPLFWIGFALFALTCAVFAGLYAHKAFPIVSLDLKMDRRLALESAKKLAQNYNWGPSDYRQAASFGVDWNVQCYVELEAGGYQAFSRMLKEGLYSPYFWSVRHFKEGETNETKIRFTPKGEPYGFKEKLPEDEPGPAISTERAALIASSTAQDTWSIDLAEYELVEQSQEVRPGGRTDHTFVYQRPDASIGQGRYRLRLVVGGDRLTELTHFVKIPEAFTRRYQKMRSANDTIYTISYVAIFILYILGGCILGLVMLVKQRRVLWRKAVLWALFIAFGIALLQLNNLPLTWMQYDTALSAQGFLLRQIVQMLANFVFLGGLMALVFIAAEGLSRKAFPHHIQMWRLWSRDVAGSSSLLGRTVGGYLVAAVYVAYLVGLYLFSTKNWGWWHPSGALFHPDMLATYCPWLMPVAISLQAGFLEECLFRAVPIAGAALLGEKFGGKRIWIGIAFVVQALVFGAGHATYPVQPAYARTVELILPSIIWGLIYLRFGLLPAIVSHYALDVVFISMPLFVSSAPGAWISRSLVIVLALVPVWVVLYCRLRCGRWTRPREEDYNRAWSPPEKSTAGRQEAVTQSTSTLTAGTARLLVAGAVLGLAVWIVFTDFSNYAPSLEVGRQEALDIAGKTLTERGVVLDGKWQPLASVEKPRGTDDRFVWQTGGSGNYRRLIGKYLEPPHWRVRFVQFEGDVAERAEEYRVLLSESGTVLRVLHQLPEARTGAELTEDEARSIAHSVVVKTYKLDPSSLKQVSVKPSQLPERKDWTFTFSDTENYPLKEGEARIAIKIAGDEVVDAYRYVHVPEQWVRRERDRKNLVGSLQILCSILMCGLVFAGLIAAVGSWSRKKYRFRVFFVFLIMLFGITVLDLVNGWPAVTAGFSTAKPFADQVFSAITSRLLSPLFYGAGLSVIIGLIHSWKGNGNLSRRAANPWTGFLAGVVLTGMLSAIKPAVPALTPPWADYSALHTFVPVIDHALDRLWPFITAAGMTLCLYALVDHFTAGWSRNRIVFSIAIVGFGLLYKGLGSIDSIAAWLVNGTAWGVMLLLAYALLFRSRLELVPPAIAAMFILAQIKQMIYNAVPSAVTGSAAAIIVLAAFSVFWHRLLPQKNNKKDKTFM